MLRKACELEGVNSMMHYDNLVQRFKNKVRPPLPIFRVLNRAKKQFVCPICDYKGPFADFHAFGGFRKHAVCPSCGALERHRIQFLAVASVLRHMNALEMKMLHFAPEKSLQALFSRRFGKYETADLFMKGVDHKVDIRALPFADQAYDLVFASHVLEHIADDGKAIHEIRRILKPNGIAILPVPVVTDKTIEYPEPNPREAGHVRAPGLDYFERYGRYFNRVEILASDSLPEKYQLFIYEDRSVWPTAECPLRPPMQGERHSDFVPVCYV
jgi:SAM-dependent methyltransferase